MAALNFPHENLNIGREYSANGKTWVWDGTSWKLKHVTSGATSFIGLSDTPNTFTADKWIKVNSSGNGLEWANAPTGGSGGDGDTTYTQSAVVSGDNVNLRLTDSSTPAVNDDILVTAGSNIEFENITAAGFTIKSDYSTFTDVAAGIVPASGGGTTKFLRADGTWQLITSGGGIDEVKDDTTPQLGGDLDLNGKNVIGTGNFSFTGVLTTRKDDVNNVVQTALQIGRLQNLSSFIVKSDGNVVSLGVVESTGFKKTGGTASQYLKADGSVSTLTTFTTSAPGLAPTSPGGTTKYLRADGTWQTIAGGTASSDPIGTIVAWAGASNNLPTGYQLCDGGASGTTELQAIVGANVPDLRDKFIIGAGNSYSVDATGGNKDAIVVQHNHGITDPGHDHRPIDANTVQSMEVGVNSTTEIFAPAQGSGVSINNASDTSSETTGISISNEGSSGNNANLPPYWALCYIIKNAATTSTGGGDGNDYVTSAQLGTGPDAKKLTLGFTDTNKNQVVDLSSLSTSDTNTTYDISLVDGTDANTKKIRLSGSNPTTIDEIIFKQGSYINLIRSGEELEIKSVATLSGLVDVDYAGQSPTANKILKYSTTVNSGAGGWTLGDDNSGSNNTDTTYSISCADGDNADEEKIRLTAGGDGSGTDDIVLEAGTGLTIARSGDKITFTNSISDTDTDKLKDLTDTPNAYDNGKYLRSTATGTEWASVTSGSSYTFSAQDHGSDNKKKILRLTDGATNQDVTIKADSYLTISRSGNEIELDVAATLSGLTDTVITGSVADNKILKYSTSANSGAGAWIVGDMAAGADGNTTYSLEALISPGIKLTGSDNTNDSVFFDAGTGITLTRTIAPGGTGGGTIKFEATTFAGEAAGLVPASTSGETTKFLKSDGSWDTAGGSITVFDETTELSTGATTLKFAGGMVSATGTGATKTITIAQPTLSCADGTSNDKKLIKLGRGSDANDEITLKAGSYININRSGDELEIVSVQALSGLSDVYIPGSVSNDKILKFSTSTQGGKWILADDNTGSSADGNNYVSSGSWNSSNGTLTLNRSGLSAVTIGVSNLKTYLENNLSISGGIDPGTPNATGSVIVWNGSSWTWSRTALINAGTSSNNTNLEVDNLSNGYGGMKIQSNGEILLKKAGSSWREGGHLQFESELFTPTQSFAIDMYNDTSAAHDSLIRVIDQTNNMQRFAVNHYGALGIGHTSPPFGSTGQVMISQGEFDPPIWASHGSIAGSEAFATNEQLDLEHAEIDHIYSQLNEIGNDDSITTVAQLKTALLALVRN